MTPPIHHPIADPEDDTLVSQMLENYTTRTVSGIHTPWLYCWRYHPKHFRSHPKRAVQLSMDCIRMGFLTNFTRKIIGTTLPLEIADLIIDFLRCEWLKIPYNFTATSLRRVWINCEEVRKTGNFQRCGIRVVSDKELVWNERDKRWDCSCGFHWLCWAPRERRWQCWNIYARRRMLQ